MVQQMCEDCGEKHAHFGEVGSSERKWCGPCAKEQVGETVLIGKKMCETCGKKHANFGLSASTVSHPQHVMVCPSHSTSCSHPFGHRTWGIADARLGCRRTRAPPRPRRRRRRRVGGI